MRRARIRDAIAFPVDLVHIEFVRIGRLGPQPLEIRELLSKPLSLDLNGWHFTELLSYVVPVLDFLAAPDLPQISHKVDVLNGRISRGPRGGGRHSLTY